MTIIENYYKIKKKNQTFRKLAVL